jgi:hypothetical protein
MKKTRAERAYPIEKVDAKLKYPRWEAVEASPGTIWFNLMGLGARYTAYCVIRHRDPLTGLILDRPELAAGPLFDMAEAQALVLQFEADGEPDQ